MMTVPVVAFFNNKGGVGKTSLVYHLAWMYAELGLNVVAADLDPQANLTAAFLDEDRLAKLWEGSNHSETIYGCIHPLKRGVGDIKEPHIESIKTKEKDDIVNPHVEPIEENIALLPGDLALSGFEDDLSTNWPLCLQKREERAFRVLSAFWRTMQRAAEDSSANVILMDLGPNLGAINRSALLSSDHVVIPLAPDLFSLKGLENLGPTLREWREDWKKRLKEKPEVDLELPEGKMEPIGYVVLQHLERLDRPVKAYGRWIEKIPKTYHSAVLGEDSKKDTSVKCDPHCLALLRHYRSLIPMAQEAGKPIFLLKPADGAIGSHFTAAKAAHEDFEKLARAIAERARIDIPLTA